MGSPSCGYDTFVTMSSKRSVATRFQMDAGRAAQIYGRPTMVPFWFAGIERIRHGKTSQANWTFWPASRPGGPFVWQSPSFGGVFRHGIVGDDSMALSNDAQIAVEQGMMIAEVNIAIGAVDRILKMAKDGKSNNRELTNARVELGHWRARLLKAIHKS
jgi:hypothetical protein